MGLPKCQNNGFGDATWSSAQMALTSHDTPAELRRKVTRLMGLPKRQLKWWMKKNASIIADAMLGMWAALAWAAKRLAK